MERSSYQLYLDDERTPIDGSLVIARTVEEAKELVLTRGAPSFMHLDHDLGGDSTSMDFLKWLYENFPDAPPPPWSVHSANPVGRDNINSYLLSWKSLFIKTRNL